MAPLMPDPNVQMSKPPRQCPECGCDRWKMREAARNADYAEQKARDAEKLAAKNGVLSYRMRVQADEHRDHISRALRKIQRQARVIKRLEARLRALEAAPYADSPLGESAPGAEYDAEHPNA